MDTQPLPSFIIAGAPRSATTWLYHAANAHPAIAMAQPVTPEPKFFLRDDLYARGLDYYSQTWFAPLPAHRLLGEKTTNYLESPLAAQRIARDLPAVRLIFLLRDPIDRAYSNYLWTRRNGMETESFERALELEKEREASYSEALRYARPHSYFSRGLYAELLEPWLQRFEREKLLFLLTEEIERNPDAVAAALYDFLGVEPMSLSATPLGIINASQADAPSLNPETRAQLAARFAQPNARLAKLLGVEAMPW